MSEKKHLPELVQFADEALPARLLPHLDADGVLVLKRDPGGGRMREALCAWAAWAPSLEVDAGALKEGYWAIWFKGTRKPSGQEISAWLQWSEGGTAPIDLNPPPVLESSERGDI